MNLALRTTVALLFSSWLVVFAPLLAQEGADSPQAQTLPPGVMARVNGRDISVDEYGKYLLASLGKSLLDEYVDRLLLEEEARTLAVEVLPEDVEKLVRGRVERDVRALYRGDRERFVAKLRASRMTLADYENKLRQELYYELLIERVVLKTRPFNESMVREAFERIYGEEGVEYSLRHILVATGPVGGGSSRTPTEAKARAEEVLRRLRAGSDFVQAVKEYSDDPFGRRNEGRVPQYRKAIYGEAFHRAVQELGEDNRLSGVVASPQGYHVIRFDGSRSVRFADVQADLAEAVRNKVPTPQERQELVEKLRKNARIEGL